MILCVFLVKVSVYLCVIDCVVLYDLLSFLECCVLFVSLRGLFVV